MGNECNHVFTVIGNTYVCQKCGDVFKVGAFAKDETEFPECSGGKCGTA